MITIFMGGIGGGYLKGTCLKWVGEGLLRDISKNTLKQGWVKVKVVWGGGGGGLKVSPPLLFWKILIIHEVM